MTVTKGEVEALTESMAWSFALIDPNTVNSEEGKSLMHQMYSESAMSDAESSSIIPVMPTTPDICFDKVAGKIIQIEELQEDIDEAEGFNTFFAQIYCESYVNSFMTVTDGMHLQIAEVGDLDYAVEREL